QNPSQNTDNPTVPTAFNYQGTLRDSDGNLIETGEYNLIFKIYPDIGTPNALFTQALNGIIVRDGRFSVTLTEIPNSVFTEGKDRFIGVTVEPFAEMVPRERLSSVPYAVMAERSDFAPGVVPVGAVIDWFSTSETLPEGYALCDGSLVEGVQLPDLNGRFAYGTTDRDQVGNTGGSETHVHGVSLPDHSHSFDISHDHAVFTATTNVIDAAAFWGFSGSNEIGNAEEAAWWHQHSVPVDVPNYVEAPRTSGEGGAANIDTAEGSSLPPFVQLLKICRYK
ncbi:MAG: hypothetical protein AAF633_24535, partial [Chloroflexota bacterium]